MAESIAMSLGYNITGITADEDKFIINMRKIDILEKDDKDIKTTTFGECRYGIKCYNKETCKFKHTEAATGGAGIEPKKYGLCNFGNKCYKKECQYKHPEKTDESNDAHFCMEWQKGSQCSAACKFKNAHVEKLNPKTYEKFLMVLNKDVFSETLDFDDPIQRKFGLKHANIAYMRACKIGMLGKDNQGKLCRNWMNGCKCKKGYYHTNSIPTDADSVGSVEEKPEEDKPEEEKPEEEEKNDNVRA
jgi:hypothetical protein